MSMILSLAALLALKFEPSRWRLPLAWVLVVASMVAFAMELP